VIEIDGLTRRYGDVTAVDDLSFTAADGEVTGFVGPNGAGKSTTMRMLLGLDRPTAGTARIDGSAYQELDRPMTHVGALLDAGWIHPGRSARAHLLWLARTARLGTGFEIATRVDEVLAHVGLHEVASKKAGGFSLGMRQRLGLAGALLGRPGHLVLDEPLNGLDPEGVHWMRRLIRDYAERGNAVLVSSHLLSELAMTADSLVVIGRGRLIGQHSTEEFVRTTAPTSVRVRVDRPDELRDEVLRHGVTVESSGPGALSLRAPDLGTDDVGDLCFRLGLRVDELTLVTGSLEEAFLAATGESVTYRSTPDPVLPHAPAPMTTDDRLEVAR